MDNVIQNLRLKGGIERAKETREKQEIENKVLRNIIEDYTIDSCDTFDEGYETAIWKGIGKTIIVERYNKYEDMKKGHKKWCDFCKTNPQSVFSIQLGEEIEF